MKYTYEQVKQEFEKRGLKLLETTYKNNKTKMKCICSCGEEIEKCLDKLFSNPKCKKCGYIDRKDPQKYSLDQVKEIFENNGCEFLDEKYVNNQHRHNYKCECGETKIITLTGFMYGQRCKQCGIKKRSQTRRTPFDEVLELFTENNCEFLDKIYVNKHHLHNFKCECGETSKIRVANFENGTRCKDCGNDSRKTTNLEKYGHITPLQNAEIKAKTISTNIERYGCENPFGNEDIKNKIKETNLEKYGSESPMQNTEVQAKARETNLEKYGCENPMQNSEIAERSTKSSIKFKEFVMPSGNIVKVQGYEDKALTILLEKYKEDELVISRSSVPEVWYLLDGKYHRYYCDIFIPKENLMIEVKSLYTFKNLKRKNMNKAMSTNCLGYNFQMYLFDAKMNLDIVEFFYTLEDLKHRF